MTEEEEEEEEEDTQSSMKAIRASSFFLGTSLQLISGLFHGCLTFMWEREGEGRH